MNELHGELAQLELEGLSLDSLEIEDLKLSSEGGLELLTTGHGMVEIGASSGQTACCSCCIVCCCCPCLG
ncbi:thiomuracin/GE37468 family thiazolyl RiPP peptide [Thermogemmatispora sp.]|uniref:thiomuracin/GE37468 family thiazolyl RiPP peptide n=1 Tax=Thermogemmatispora sp. TaxID=1968838 RepID=UPI00257A8F54|nr:thiomuracin/GE37468 family thiazolyl RiPP peptide [Thermogemmatispora sp.]